MLASVVQDLRYAVRGFLRSPGPLSIALAAMALGIGGTTAVFSVVDRTLFRDLPYARQERLVWFGMKAPISNNEFLLEADFANFRAHQTVFEEMTSIARVGECDLNEAEPLRLVCAQVAANFLPAFGYQPTLGRNIAPAEDVPNGERTALLSDGFWRRRFGGDPGVLGRTLAIDGRPARIVGVLPRGFELPTLARADVLLPQQLAFDPRARFTFLTAFGILKPGVTIAQARAALWPLYQDSLKSVPAGFVKEVSFHVSLLRDRQARDYRTASLTLLAAVAGVLLIACANVAGLLVARAAARQREWAVRAAIGASRGRLVRQMLTESVVLALAGGAAGLAVAAGLLRVLVSFAPPGIPRLAEASLDGRVLWFALAISTLCGLLFGIVPALRTPRAGTLNSARTVGGGVALRQALVAAQIGLSFVLLTAAGLLMESLWNMQHVDFGMRPEHLMTARVQLGQRYPAAPQQAEFFERAFEELRRTPGVKAAALADSAPLYGPTATMIFSNIEIQGRAAPEANRPTGGMAVFRTVSPGYFETMGIRMARGRAFVEDDRSAGEHAAIIDEALARRLFPDEDPLGRRMRAGLAGPWRTIVGVAARVKNAGITGGDDPEYYLVWRRGPLDGRRRGHFLLRSEASPSALADAIRAAIARLDPQLPVTVATMEQNLGRHIERPRFEGLLLCLFAGIGVLLAAVGQYGVIAYLVTQRAREIGVRVALGASGRNVAGLVLGQTLRWTLAGAAGGLVMAWFGSRQIESLLFGVEARALGNYAAAFTLLVGASLAAAWQPARRAARMDPARALRHE